MGMDDAGRTQTIHHGAQIALMPAVLSQGSVAIGSHCLPANARAVKARALLHQYTVPIMRCASSGLA